MVYMALTDLMIFNGTLLELNPSVMLRPLLVQLCLFDLQELLLLLLQLIEGMRRKQNDLLAALPSTLQLILVLVLLFLNRSELYILTVSILVGMDTPFLSALGWHQYSSFYLSYFISTIMCLRSSIWLLSPL